MSDLDKCKTLAAKEAAKFVVNERIIGIGTGSTVEKFIDILGEFREEFHNKLFVASSLDTKYKLIEKGFKVLDLLSVREIDVYIDGADEVDPDLNMIKGGGAAHTMEKILAFYSKNRVFIVDYTKLVNRLGEKHPVPIEIIPEALSLVKKYLEKKGYRVTLRYPRNGKYGPVISDTGGLILDIYLNGKDYKELLNILEKLPGVIEHGLFIGYADYVIIGYPQKVDILSPKNQERKQHKIL